MVLEHKHKVANEGLKMTEAQFRSFFLRFLVDALLSYRVGTTVVQAVL